MSYNTIKRPDGKIVIKAAQAAIEEAIKVAGDGELNVSDLITGMISLIRTGPAFNQDAAEFIVSRLAVDAISLVGAKRAHELIDHYSQKNSAPLVMIPANDLN